MSYNYPRKTHRPRAKELAKRRRRARKLFEMGLSYSAVAARLGVSKRIATEDAKAAGWVNNRGTGHPWEQFYEE